MEPKILILMVGLPRSGKTTAANGLVEGQGAVIVNSDLIRKAIHGEAFIPTAEPFVWAIARVMVQALFLAGHTVVILDATNNTKARRDAWKGPWKRMYHTVDTSKKVCIQRAVTEGDEEIVPVIERMAEAFEPVEPDELIDR